MEEIPLYTTNDRGVNERDGPAKHETGHQLVACGRWEKRRLKWALKRESIQGEFFRIGRYKRFVLTTARIKNRDKEIKKEYTQADNSSGHEAASADGTVIQLQADFCSATSGYG